MNAKAESSGEAKHTNRLIDATSPYLLQHANNPVDWYEWGGEALAKAKELDKPIFLSVGYSACHWCHVMAHESFENEEIAKVMNEHFVNIKVDREERPDIDEIYMNSVQLMTGQGGWPMSVFLTPDLKPFFGGTYFPPEDRFGRPGFKRVATQIAQAWQAHRKELEQQGEKLADAIKSMGAVESGGAVDRDLINAAVEAFESRFDPREGGFGEAPKFPPSMGLDLLMRQYKHTGQSRVLEMVELTLQKMAGGGMYDQLGGGFHRYSTDADWLVPHFEKMLYDNSLLVPVYLDAYQITGNADYSRIASETLDWVLRDMRHSEGGFYSTLDADSEGEEGKFYVWTLEEIEQFLDERDAELFSSYYDVTASGNWEGHNIPNVERPAEVVARLNDVSEQALFESLNKSKQTLLALRNKRVWPGLDDKILTAWNGLMITAMARGYAVLDDDRYLQAAQSAASFVLQNMQEDGRLLRTYREGRAHLAAYLDDYAFFVAALIDLFEVTGNYEYLSEARRLTDVAIAHYLDRDGESGAGSGFFFVAGDHEELIARTKNPYDNAIPSGNSVMAFNLLRLGKIFDDENYHAIAGGTLAAFATLSERAPMGFGRLLAAMDLYLEGGREIVIAGAAGSPDRNALLQTVWETYLPNKLVAPFDPNGGNVDTLASLPLFTGKRALGGKATAFVCRNFACELPVNDPGKLAEQLD